MRRSQQIVFLLLPALSLLSTSCASLGNGCPKYREAPTGELFLSPAPDFENAAHFEKWLDSLNELDKIRYLLERIALSEHRFIRNGESHDGKIARQWLLYKMKHWVSGVESAQDFVARVASFSQKTGSPYLVEYSDGKVYSLGSVLRNELSAFESHLAKLRVIRQQSMRGTVGVSISPTAVASRAVAHSSTKS